MLRADVLKKLYLNRGDGALYNIDEEIESNPVSSRYNESKEYQRIIHELERSGLIETNSKQLKSIKKHMPILTPPIGINKEEYHKMINFQYPKLEGRITIRGEEHYEGKNYKMNLPVSLAIILCLSLVSFYVWNIGEIIAQVSAVGIFLINFTKNT